jgi:sugar phosphate isomerase/epimerase
MRISQVALQLYTVRDKLTSPSDVAETFARIREIGYEAVQFFPIECISVSQAAGLLAEAGLVCCSTHFDTTRLLEEPQAIIEDLAALQCASTALPYPSGMAFDTADDVLDLCKRLDAVGRVYHEAGVSFAYHNHAIEFRRFEGRLMLDIIYDETNPEWVQGEPDTYWIQYGGGDSVGWCRKLKGRLPLLHLKDYQVTPDETPFFAEIGRGNLDWKAIIGAADEGGCEWYIVEQDRCDRDTLEAAEISFIYLRDYLCS